MTNFYKSKEWINLLKVLKSERVNEQGQLICEHCGEPIIKSYDCIGHHIIPLTEENEHDAMIALNPDNIALVHHRCHNKIHNKLSYNERYVYLVYGSPLSGKTTFVKENMEIGDLVVDVDNIWQCVSGCDRYTKPPRLNAVVFNIRDTLINSIKYRLGRWQSAWLIGGYPLISERERLCKQLRAREIFIDTSYDECVARLNACSDRNHDEWLQYIDAWWQKHV